MSELPIVDNSAASKEGASRSLPHKLPRRLSVSYFDHEFIAPTPAKLEYDVSEMLDQLSQRSEFVGA